MNSRPSRLRHAWLAPALLVALCPTFACIGASDDRLGSGNASKEGSGVDEGTPIHTKTQGLRDDKGDNPQAGTGTARSANVDAAKTGGMGENRGETPILPGDTGPHSSSAPGVGPK